MKVYIDQHYICHVEPAANRREFEVAGLDGKCRFYVEHYRYVPAGESWTDESGTVYNGEFLAPAVDYAIIEAVQSSFEESQEQIDLLTGCLLEVSEMLYIYLRDMY